MLRRLGLAMLLAGCSSIPVIRFMDDASIEDAEADGEAEDGGMTADAPDAGPVEGGLEASTCPGMVPDGAVTCCGQIPCGTAYCTMAACIECTMKCGVGTICCPNMGGKATCVVSTVCP